MKQANLRTDYCEQCNRFQDSCAAAAAEEEEEQAAYDEEAVDEEQEGEEEQGEQEQGEQEQEQEGEEAMDEQEQEGEAEQAEQEQGEQEFEEEKEEQNAQAYEMANGGRKLKQQIDCNQCESLQCFTDDADDADDAENGQADIDTMVAEWIEEVANCKATDQYVNGMQVYLGPICSDGLYFEIGAFLNEVSLFESYLLFLYRRCFLFP